jgi:hypothetical protein
MTFLLAKKEKKEGGGQRVQSKRDINRFTEWPRSNKRVESSAALEAKVIWPNDTPFRSIDKGET